LTIISVAGGTNTGSKQFTVSCPKAGDPKPGGGTYSSNYVAISGGFNIQGSVVASYRSSPTGDASGVDSWTIIQTSGASLSGTEYVYCMPS